MTMSPLSFVLVLAAVCGVDGRTLAARGGARAAASKLSPKAPGASDAQVSKAPAQKKAEKSKKERAPAPTMAADVPYQDPYTYERALHSQQRKDANAKWRASMPKMAATVPYQDAYTYERALHDKRRQAKEEARKERAPAPTMSASNTLSTTGPFVDAYVYERSLQQKKQRKPPTEFVQFLFDRGLVHFFDPN